MATKESREQPEQVTQWLGMDMFYGSFFHLLMWALEFVHFGVKCVCVFRKQKRIWMRTLGKNSKAKGIETDNIS